MRTVALDDAIPETSGSKASTLAQLRRASIDVPDGFVIPMSEYRRHHGNKVSGPVGRPLDSGLVDAIEAHLQRLLGRADGGYVAVRSSATDEDGHQSSSAGQHDTVLAVRGTEAVAAAVVRCWASLHSPPATSYRQRRHLPAGRRQAMAVVVQRFVDPDLSGVTFTQTPRIIEAIRGLGSLLVDGQVTPDAWTLDDTGIIARRPGTCDRRLDRHWDQLITSSLRHEDQMCLDEADVRRLDLLGRTIAETLGYDADVEWAITGHRIHTLQARPITAALTQRPRIGHGIPASPGHATGTTRVLGGPWDFHRFQPGDIIVCRATDPAWTPLFGHAAGIITETGGLLSHAAIVARELGIPAILAVPHATTRFPDGTLISIDGATGHIRQ